MKPEESIRLRVAVLVAVVAAATAVLREGVGGPLLYAAVLVGIPAGFAYSHRARHDNHLWPKLVVAAGVLLVLVDFFGAVDGMRSAAEAQIPLAELFVWVQVLHAFDVPARRNLLVGLLSSLVLIAVAGVLSVSLDYGALFLVWAAAAGAALVLAHRSDLDDVAPLGPTTATRRPILVVAPAMLVGALAVFTLLPAAGSARALTFPMALPDKVPTGGLPGALSNPTLGPADTANGTAAGTRATFAYTGFSTELDTAVRGRPDDTLVMRVRASSPALWRGQTFDRWDGRRWTTTAHEPTMVGGGNRIRLPLPPEEQGAADGETFVQTFYLEKPGPNLIFGAYPMSELYFADRRVFSLPDGSVRAGVELDDEAVYTVVSKRLPVTADTLRAADGNGSALPPWTDEAALDLPVVAPRVAALAAEITAAAPTTYDKVQAIVDWMAANTRYTLDIPPLPEGADAVEHFLFEDRRGFCEQIGTALVVLLRSLGIPARLAVGYAPGERNPFTGLFEVRARDAHAWAEVYFEGIGWQGFDPTAEVPLAGDGGLRAGSGLAAFVGARLPSIPAPAPAILALAALAAITVNRRRRPAPPTTWPEQWQAQLEHLGRATGRPRRDGETVREYVDVVGRLVPHPDWRAAVEAVEAEAYGGLPASPDQRATADGVLSPPR